MKQGWEIKKLGDIAQISYGYTEKADYEQNGPKFLRITDIQDKGVDWNNVPYCKCNEIDLAKYKLEAGDVVFARTGATTGKSYLIRNPPNAVFASYLIKLRLKDKYNFIPEYISYFFQTQSYWDVIKNGISGSAQGGFNAAKLGIVEMPIPPLPEQERIVSILDKAFSAIDQAKQNAEKNLKNAKELFDSYLNGIFTNKDKDWKEETLKDLTTVLGDGLHGTPKYTIDGEYHFINGNNLADGVIVLKENTKRVSMEEYNKYKKNLTDRTVLVSINGTLGNVAFYNGEKIILGKSACYFNLKESINRDFVRYVFKSPYFLQYAHKEATGATIKNVSLKTMREFIIPVPNFKTQQIIVQKLDALQTETKQLEAIYQQKITELEELKKSILQKAFNGELI